MTSRKHQAESWKARQIQILHERNAIYDYRTRSYILYILVYWASKLSYYYTNLIIFKFQALLVMTAL